MPVYKISYWTFSHISWQTFHANWRASNSLYSGEPTTPQIPQTATDLGPLGYKSEQMIDTSCSFYLCSQHQFAVLPLCSNMKSLNLSSRLPPMKKITTSPMISIVFSAGKHTQKVHHRGGGRWYMLLRLRHTWLSYFWRQKEYSKSKGLQQNASLFFIASLWENFICCLRKTGEKKQKQKQKTEFFLTLCCFKI